MAQKTGQSWWALFLLEGPGAPSVQKRDPISSVYTSLLVLLVYLAYPCPAEKAAGEFPSALLSSLALLERTKGRTSCCGREGLMAVCWEFFDSCAMWFLSSPGECESPAPVFAQWEI